MFYLPTLAHSRAAVMNCVCQNCKQSWLAQQPGERKPDTYSPTCSVVAEVRNTEEAVPSRYLFELDRDNHVGSTAGGIHGGRSCCSHLIPLIH